MVSQRYPDVSKRRNLSSDLHLNTNVAAGLSSITSESHTLRGSFRLAISPVLPCSQFTIRAGGHYLAVIDMASPLIAASGTSSCSCLVLPKTSGATDGLTSPRKIWTSTLPIAAYLCLNSCRLWLSDFPLSRKRQKRSVGTY
jgi:hypothetical protein